MLRLIIAAICVICIFMVLFIVKRVVDIYQNTKKNKLDTMISMNIYDGVDRYSTDYQEGFSMSRKPIEQEWSTGSSPIDDLDYITPEYMKVYTQY